MFNYFGQLENIVMDDIQIRTKVFVASARQEYLSTMTTS
jgi:hypothetical protein